MNCPVCNNPAEVINTRSFGFYVRRRRQCIACGNRFTTEEWLVIPTNSKKSLVEITRDEYMDL